MTQLFSLESRFFLYACLIFGIIGCHRGTEPTDGKSAPPKIDPPTSVSATTDEGTAKEKLRIALESWQFGDSEESLKQKHPEIDRFSNFGAIMEYVPYKPKLQRFEITSGRSFAKNDAPSLKFYEFNVIHTFESKAGTEIKRGHVYEIFTSDGKKWSINANLK